MSKSIKLGLATFLCASAIVSVGPAESMSGMGGMAGMSGMTANNASDRSRYDLIDGVWVCTATGAATGN